MTNHAPVLKFPVDRGIRRLYFVEEAFTHPAKLHLGLLQWLIDRYTSPGDTLLDPMAGTGSLMIAATQQRNVILRDIEPSYVALMQKSLPIVHRRAGLFGGLIDIDQADARTLVCPPFNCAIFRHPMVSRRLPACQPSAIGRCSKASSGLAGRSKPMAV